MKAVVNSGVRLLIVWTAITALASCGGGGGGGATTSTTVPNTPVALTQTNAQSVTGATTSAALQTSGQAGFFVQSAGAQSSALPKTHVLSQFMSRQIDRASQYLQSPSAILAGVATTSNCTVSGTFTEDFTSATSVTYTFNACADRSGESVNGTVTISNITSTASTFGATSTINLTFSWTGSSDATTTGSFTVSETGIGTGTETITLCGSEPLTTTTANNTENVSNFSFQSVFTSTTITENIALTFASTAIDGSVRVTTPTEFQTTSGRTFPHAGVQRIDGAGSAIRVTALGDETGATPQVHIEVDSDGDGTFESTQTTNLAQLMG